MSFPVDAGLLCTESAEPARSITMAVVSSTDHPAAVKRSLAQKIGIGISVLVGAFLVFDAAGKLAGVPQVKEGTAALGFPAEQALVMGIVLSVCLVVYAIPRTAVLGALGITAYLGGAVTANMRVEAPLFSATLFAVYLGLLMWVGLVLRRPGLSKVAGLTR
jgi:DoxX-like family